MAICSKINFRRTISGLLIVLATAGCMSERRDKEMRNIARDIKIEEISDFSPVSIDNPELYAYGFERCDYIPIPSIADDSLNVIRDGEFPAFEFQGAKFVVLMKGRSWSRGVAVGSIDENINELYRFRFERFSDDLTLWTLNLQKN